MSISCALEPPPHGHPVNNALRDHQNSLKIIGHPEEICFAKGMKTTRHTGLSKNDERREMVKGQVWKKTSIQQNAPIFFLRNHLSLQPYKRVNHVLSNKLVITQLKKQMKREVGEGLGGKQEGETTVGM